MFFVVDRIAAKTTLRSRRCACRVSDTWNAGYVTWFSSDLGRPSHIFISFPELFLRVFTGFYCYTATLLYGLRCFYCYTESLRKPRYVSALCVSRQPHFYLTSGTVFRRSHFIQVCHHLQEFTSHRADPTPLLRLGHIA